MLQESNKVRRDSSLEEEEQQGNEQPLQAPGAESENQENVPKRRAPGKDEHQDDENEGVERIA